MRSAYTEALRAHNGSRFCEQVRMFASPEVESNYWYHKEKKLV